MPIAVESYAQFQGFAVAPDDIRQGEAEAKTLPVTSELGQTLAATFRRYSLQITIRGIRADQAQPYLLAAQQAGLNLFNGSPQVQNIALLGRVFFNCMLVDCQISQPTGLNTTQLIEEMVLTYESQVFV